MARIEYGKTPRGKVVHVAKARRDESYTCPTCGHPLELRRGPHLEYFAHWRNHPGTEDCADFTPDDDNRPQSPQQTNTARRPASLPQLEDVPTQLGVVLAQLDDRWALGLRIPEVTSEELGAASLTSLRAAAIDIFSGDKRVARVSALDLRPGVGAARAEVPPAARAFRAEPTGDWPATINPRRWRLQALGLSPGGTLFRLRGGEWLRLLAGSGVHHDETLLLMAPSSAAPPPAIVVAARARIAGPDVEWEVWEVCLPTAPTAAVDAWLARVGHEFAPRPWSIDVATPPRRRAESGAPIFWAGDAAVLTLEAPRGRDAATLSLHSNSNSHSETITASDAGRVHLAILAHHPSDAHVSVVAERSANVSIEFVPRPSPSAVLKLLSDVPRLRVVIAGQTMEAWQAASHAVPLGPREAPEVTLELGSDDARARVTVIEGGKRRSRRGLDARGASRAVQEALPTATRIEIDADNLGRVALMPSHVTAADARPTVQDDRLAWRDFIVANATPGATPALIPQPKASASLAPRLITAAGLARARLGLRHRRAPSGSTS